ncbi:DUF302 domain-containing protein [Alloacidobacterium dinghuense]|nr:DUF302 domain-containing protein [Alloacidobacterium dinghuense]
MITKIEIERFSVISLKPFAEILAAINAGIAHPNMADLFSSIQRAKSSAEMEDTLQKTIGPCGLMLFATFDQGAVIDKGVEHGARGVVRLLIGNPLIMASMARHVPDAGSYAPVTVLVDERADGVHISYDRMSSFLAPYGNSEALKIALDLDGKIERLLEQAAS